MATTSLSCCRGKKIKADNDIEAPSSSKQTAMGRTFSSKVGECFKSIPCATTLLSCLCIAKSCCSKAKPIQAIDYSNLPEVFCSRENILKACLQARIEASEFSTQSIPIKELKSINRGREGVIYQWTDQERLFAVKMESEGRGNDVRYREASVACFLPLHPNVITVHTELDVVMENGSSRKALIMDTYEGAVDMQQHYALKKPPFFSFNQALPKFEKLQRLALFQTLAMDLVLGLRHLHHNHIIYRDMKPENCLLVPIEEGGFRAVLIDLGYARDPKTHSGLPRRLERVKALEEGLALTPCGSANYCAPEVFNTEKAHSNGYKRDIWSLGAFLYTLALGTDPLPQSLWGKDKGFLGFNSIEELETAKAESLYYPTGFPGSLRNLIESLMHLNPSKRPSIDKVAHHPFFQKKYVNLS